MKTLLIATDFSTHSKHAAAYGYDLARQLGANIILCNAIIAPAEVPQSGMVAWPLEESDFLLNASTDQLNSLKHGIARKDHSHGFKPAIDVVNREGLVTEVTAYFVENKHVELTVIGTHNHSGMDEFFFGNHTRKLIDEACGLLLIVPSSAKILPVKKIAFATDFKNAADDLAGIYALIPMAKLLNAEILITHVYDERDHSPKFESYVEGFMRELSNKANYPNIYYRVVQNNRTQAGLDWLCDHGQIDMLAMVHRPCGFFETLFNSSYTKKMAGSASVPVLVYPGKKL